MSSAAIISDSLRILIALKVISSRLPIGVDIMCNTDIPILKSSFDPDSLLWASLYYFTTV